MTEALGKPDSSLRNRFLPGVLRLGIRASTAKAIGDQAVSAAAPRLEHPRAEASAGSASVPKKALRRTLQGFGGSCEGVPTPTSLPLLQSGGGGAAEDKKGSPSPLANQADTAGVMDALAHTTSKTEPTVTAKTTSCFRRSASVSTSRWSRNCLLIESANLQNGDDAQLASRQDFSMSVEKNDSVNLFSALNMANPIGCNPLTPWAGAATINRDSVTVSNLIVDAAPTIDTLSSDTIRATVSDLGRGGDLVASVLDLPSVLKHPNSAPCTIDDLVDKSRSSIPAVTVGLQRLNTGRRRGSIWNHTSTDQTGTIQIGSQARQLSPNILWHRPGARGIRQLPESRGAGIEIDDSPRVAGPVGDHFCHVQ